MDETKASGPHKAHIGSGTGLFTCIRKYNVALLSQQTWHKVVVTNQGNTYGQVEHVVTKIQ